MANVKEKYNVKLMSINIRGLNSRKKRRNMFRWIKRQKIDICLLQETYSVHNLENIWRSEWGGQMYFSHGTNHGRGVMTLIRPGFDAKVINSKTDDIGRLLLLELSIQDTIFKLVNIYAPNTEESQIHFFKYLKKTMENNLTSQDRILVAGDFNFIFNNTLDRKGGVPIKNTDKRNQIINVLSDLKKQFEVQDIWRIKHPDTLRFTWRRENPRVKSRLDFWLTSEKVADSVENTRIIPVIGTDHSAVYLHLKSFVGADRGRGLWRLNTSFLQEEDYVKGIIQNKEIWLNEFADITDPQIMWELVKYRIRQFSAKYGKEKAQRLKSTESDQEEKLANLEREQDQAQDDTNIESLNKDIQEIKSKLAEIADYKTQGLILKSQTRWYEKGEKSNKYFLNLITRNQVRKCISKIQKEDGTFTTDNTEILDLQAAFYKKLYSNKCTKTEHEIELYLEKLAIPKLNENDRNQCEGVLTLDECHSVLKQFKNNKAPGNDGIPVDFYKKFWPLFGKLMVESFNDSYKTGQLTTSQRQAVISLLDKGKDRTLLKNWRPISLLNADYKIASKALAERFTSLLPKLVSDSQVGYVKSRNIIDNIKTIVDLVEFLKRQNRPGILVNIDFEKAFDSLDWSFLFSILKAYNFGPSFISWIQTLYNNISSCTINNGYTSKYFTVERGVRQGDPLSPYLFILAVEVMAQQIRQNRGIQGINIKDTEIKLLQYADDTNGLLTDIDSAREFLAAVRTFGDFSGLKLNIEKTEGMWLGSLRNSREKPLGIVWSEKSLRVLGVYVSYDETESNKLNFDNKVCKAKQLLNLWSSRNLTLHGRIQIVKTFIISQFNFVCSVLPTPDYIIKQINSLIFTFIWKGKKERIKRSILITDIKQGGLHTPDMETITKTCMLKWIKRLVSSTATPPWKQMLEIYLDRYKVKLDLLLYSNYSLKTLGIKKGDLPLFYYALLYLWSDVGNVTAGSKDKLLWYNKDILIEGKAVLYRDFLQVGIWYVADLYDDIGQKIPFAVWKSRGVKSVDILKWMSLIVATQTLSKVSDNGDEVSNLSLDLNVPLISMNSKAMYHTLLVRKTGNALYVPRVAKYIEDQPISWSEVYVRGNSIPIDTKTREFQYKFIQDVLANNYWLHKWGIKESAQCIYCKDGTENLQHMFWMCPITKRFWHFFEEFYANKIGHIELSIENVFLGVSDHRMYRLILAAKRYVYIKRIHEEDLPFMGYISTIKNQKSIEFQIAKENNMTALWYENWNFLDD